MEDSLSFYLLIRFKIKNGLQPYIPEYKKGTYLFSLPGSTGACKDAWDQIIKFQLDSNYKPCNLVEILSRIK